MCDHPTNCIIYDDHEGTEICTNCALVLNTVYVYANNSQNELENMSNTIINDNEGIQYLESLHEKGCFPHTVYTRTVTELRHLQRKQKIIKKRFLNNELAAFALYWVLIDFCLDETPEIVSKWFNTTIKKLTEIKKYLSIDQKRDTKQHVNYYTYVSRFISFLQYENPDKWKYSDIKSTLKLIQTLHKTYNLTNIRPQTLSVAILYLYFCHKNHVFPYKTPMKHLQYMFTVCNVSAYNIKKVLKHNFYHININDFIS